MKIKRHSMRKQILFSFIFLIVIVEIILSISLFSFYSSTQLKTAADATVTQLSQASGSADILYQQMLAVQNTVYADSDVFHSITTNQRNYVDENVAVRALRKIQSSHSYIWAISVYNPALNLCISTNGVFELFQEETDEIEAVLNGKHMASYPREMSIGVYRMRKKNVYTFLFRFFSGHHDTEASFVMIDIDPAYLGSIIETITDSGFHPEVSVFDSDHKMISHTNKAFFMTQMEETPYAEQLVKQSEISGSFRYQDEQAMQLTFVRSEESGWLFVATQPRNAILGPIYLLACITVVIFLVLFLLGIMLASRLSSRLHSPIRRMYEEYATKGTIIPENANEVNELAVLDETFSLLTSKTSTLEDKLSTSQNMARYTYIRFLLDGSTAKIRPNTDLDSETEKRFQSNGFLPVLIEYDEFTQRYTSNPDLILYQYALENLASELLSDYGGVDFLYMGENRFAALLYLEHIEIPHTLDQKLEQLITIMMQEFNMQITCCIGEAVDNTEKISESYRKVVVAMKQRLASDYQTVLFAQDIVYGLQVRANPKKLQAKLVETVRTGNEEDIQSVLEEWITSISEMSWSYAQNLSKHTMMTLIGKFNAQIKTSKKNPEIFELIERVNSCQSIDSLQKVMIGFLLLLQTEVRINREKGNPDIVTAVVTYIDYNYMNPDLSITGLAEHFHFSAPYLGKIFTEKMSMSVTDYLNKVRLRYACELLQNTDLPASKISHQVGIDNPNYFYRLFKKHMGITPSKYRENHQQ